jgi:hypothetical protein
MAVAVTLAGVLVAAALFAVAGRTVAAAGLGLAIIAALAVGVWTYRAARTHRSTARPLSHFEGGAVKP